MPPQLVVVAGPDKGRVFPLTAGETISIGRGSRSDTRLVDLSVSRIHCEIRFEANRARVSDANSASGTFVNGKLISAEQELRAGDVIRIGETQLRFEDDIAEESTLMPGAVPVKKTTGAVPSPRGPTRAVVTPTNPTRAVPSPAASPKPAGDVVFANKPGQRILPRPLKDLHELAGTSLGNYRLRRVAGTGQIGVVFEAEDTKSDKLLALKVLRADFAKDAKAMRRFVRGMMAMRSLSHPNLIELYNAGITGAHCWIAMEYIDGSSLTEIMRDMAGAAQRDWKLAVRIATDIGAALGFLHDQVMIHRNVTPPNILVQKRDGRAKLGDAMLAKALEGNAEAEVTASGEFVGNIFYMAPERTVSGAVVDGRADFFSLGVTLYTLLTGRIPFEGTSLPVVITKVRQAAPERPKRLQPAIPDALESIVLKLLGKRPEDRYPSAKELLADLGRVRV
jgi:pSer/pThr/pTyr-binding forkhead associated (FHA) protein